MRITIAAIILGASVVAGCQSPQPAKRTLALSVPAQPILAIAKTNAAVWLRWDPGIPNDTVLRNLTTGVDYHAGSSDNLEVRGLVPGSTNRFVAFNDAGFSNEAVGVATVPFGMASIAIHTFMVEVPVQPNQPAAILTSTNLLTWETLGVIVSTNSVHRFVWTNDNANRFFRSAKP